METWKIILISVAGAAVLGTGIWAAVHFTTQKPTSYSPEVINEYKNW
jgi:hypothetical protein